MYPGLWRTGNLDLIEFFLEPAAITGGKFYSGEQNHGSSEVWFARFTQLSGAVIRRDDFPTTTTRTGANARQNS